MTLIKIRLRRLTVVASLRNKILYFFFLSPRLKCILPRLIFHPVIYIKKAKDERIELERKDRDEKELMAYVRDSVKNYRLLKKKKKKRNFAS